MKAVESSARLTSFHIPGLGRCNIISTGTGGSVTSKATMRSLMADSMMVNDSSGISKSPHKAITKFRVSINRQVVQKTITGYDRTVARQKAQAFVKRLLFAPQDRSVQ